MRDATSGCGYAGAGLVLIARWNYRKCRPICRRLASTAATSRPVTDVLESTASILEVVVSLVVSTTTGASAAYFDLPPCSSTHLPLFLVVKYSTNFDKYHPGYFGKVGMRYYHYTANKDFTSIINVDKLWTLVPKEHKEGLTADSEMVPVVDITRHGYTKVLGNGL